MIELKSKKTSITHVISDEEYALAVRKKAIDFSRFIVTKLTMRPIIPSFPKDVGVSKIPIPVPTPEIKITKKPKHEG
jgi:hypothetical protein